MMQWLVNEWKDFRVEVRKSVSDLTTEWSKNQVETAEKILKLEGEIRAMKARMGKSME